jgi:general secretion pathway protein J
MFLRLIPFCSYKPSSGYVERSLRRERASCRGFSLIELLVALVLLSLMFALLTSSLGFGTKLWSDHEQDSAQASHVMIVEGLLRRLLSEARPVAESATKDAPWHVKFSGHKKSIKFTAPMLERFATGGFYEINIRTTQGNISADKIEMSWSLPKQLGKKMNAVLFEGNASLEFAFFGSQKVGEPPRWHADWSYQRTLPELVLVRLTLGGRRWPDLLVAPKVQSINLIQPPTVF